MNSFENVAVLMGGWSAEREVSLKSGQAVYNGLCQQGIHASIIDVDRNIGQVLEQGEYSHVFNMLHGRGGEDGVIQGLLDIMQIPYTGSGVLGSALAMDKSRCKQLWQGLNLSTPDFLALNNADDCERALEILGLPLMVKPVLEGSSIGISKVNIKDDMMPAWEKAKACGGVVIAEKFIQGEEYTAAILDDQVLPMIRLGTHNEFYDYDAKYISNDTQYICPCGLTKSFEVELASLMLTAFKSIMGEGWGRVDFMLDKNQQPWLIEVNTIPGMTSHSLVPMAAKHAGMTFENLVLKILQGAYVRG